MKSEIPATPMAKTGPLVSPETAKLALSFLEEAVTNGTGKNGAIEGVRVGGKTGTAQIYDPKLRKYLENEYVMSFVTVAPVESPRFVVLVRVVKPTSGLHGSDTAAPTARRVLEAALRLTDGDADHEQPAAKVASEGTAGPTTPG